MKNQDIFDNALRILGQPTVNGENEDYEERAPYLIAAFCTEAVRLDEAFRKLIGDSSVVDFHKVWLPLDTDFPLLDRLAPLACLYVAAMLVLDENSELSDKLYDRYCDGMSTAWSEIPAAIQSIEKKYFAD